MAARDWEGSTSRDYLFVFDVPDADQLQQIIDDHVVEMIYNDQSGTGGRETDQFEKKQW